MKPEAGQWWVAERAEAGDTAQAIAVRIEHILPNGDIVVEAYPGKFFVWKGANAWHYEPRCTGWDWVVPEQPPAEDPDEWVIQDRVPVRVGIDMISWHGDVPHDYMIPPTKDGASSGRMHGSAHPWNASEKLRVWCRRRDLPKVEQPEQCAACEALAEPGTAGCKDCNEYAAAICSPEQAEQWPKYYTTLDGPSSDVAFVKRVDETSYTVVYKNGREYPGFLWVAKNQSRRKQITEAEAMTLLKKPQPQPQKTRVRLWARPDGGHIWFCHDKPANGWWQEIHHDSEGFYVENQP